MGSITKSIYVAVVVIRSISMQGINTFHTALKSLTILREAKNEHVRIKGTSFI